METPVPEMRSGSASESSKVFISYSSSNTTFARSLDVAISIHGAQVFLDEREIRVGDSIPEAVFGAIEKSSHLIFVISKESVVSGWVRDEISAAKMRQNHLGQPKILPVLIDDCEVPSSIRHIRYADFRGWENPRAFSAALSSVLAALGLVRLPPTGSELRLFLDHYEEYLLAGAIASQLAGYAEGAYYADRWAQSMISSENFNWAAARKALDTFVYGAIEDPLAPLYRFSARCAESGAVAGGAVKNLAALAIALADGAKAACQRRLGPQDFINLQDLALRVSSAIRVLAEEYLSILAAGFG